MVLKEDQERVLKILKETIALLCKNGLNYISDLKIEGLIGVTIDKSEIFLVNLNECITYDNKLHPNDEEQTIIKSVTTTSHNVNTFSSVVHCNRLQLIDNDDNNNNNHNDRNNNNNNFNNNNQSNNEIIKNVKVELDCDSDNSPYDDLDLPDPSTIEINNEPPICQLINDKNCSGLPSPLHLNENTWIKVHEVRTKNQMLRHSSQSYRVNNSIGKHNKLVGQSTELRTTENCILNDRYIMQQHRHRNELTSLSSSSLIDDKLRSHPVVCNMCGKRFPRKLFLQAHLSTQHGLPKPFKCGKCGKGYAYKQQLNKHLLQCSFSVQAERT